MSIDYNRCALVIPSLRPGGAQRALLSLAAELLERGREVDLVVVETDVPGETLREEVPPGVTLVEIGARRVLSSGPRLVRYLRTVRPGAVLATQDHMNVMAWLAVRFSGVPTRLVLRLANTFTVQREAEHNSPAGRALYAAAAAVYRHADRVVAPSSGVARDLRQALGLPADQPSVIANPVVTPELSDLAAQPLTHPWAEESNDDRGRPPLLLAVGRLTAAKGFDVLIDAVALVREHIPVRLMILGDGERRQALQSQIDAAGLHDAVQLGGFDPNPYRWMSRCELFVLSSRYEGLPAVLIQAQACGANLVATDCPSGPREILEDGRHGQLVEVGDVDALAKAILAALEQPGDPYESIAAARRRYSRGPVTAEYDALLFG